MKKVELMIQTINQIRQLFHQFAHRAEELHNHSLKAPQRMILQEIHEFGRQTIPEIARKKKVTRQHILKLATSLEKEGYVHYEENPIHKRSFHIVLTDKGSQWIQKALKAEKEFLEHFTQDLKRDDLENCLHLLQKVSRKLNESEK